MKYTKHSGNSFSSIRVSHFSGVSSLLFAVSSVINIETFEFPEIVEDITIPEHTLTVIAGIVVFILLIGLYAVIKRIRQTNGEELQKVLSGHDEVTVLMHPNPDPDAMASAMAVSTIAESVDTTPHVQYTGQIRHQENRAFRTVLDFNCESIESTSELATQESIVLVDHNTPRGFTGAEKTEPIAVVDHHPGNGTGEQFTDVKSEYGSCATILTEYLIDLDAVLKTEDVSSEELEEAEIVIDNRLATGLAYGVYSDTDNLTRGCVKPDFDVCSTLFNAIDTDKLNRIENPEVSHDVLKVKADAIMNIQIEGSFGVCNTGSIDNVDSLSQAVDELMRIEGVTAAIVYGKRNGTIHMSGRSHDDRVHMGECLHHAVNEIKHSSAGGHARMGGGQIPVTHMADIGTGEGIPYEEFNELLFLSMNGDH